MCDYGISAELPVLTKDKVQAIIERLADLGVPHECTLQDVAIEDLMEGKLLGKIPARKLVRKWQAGDENGNLASAPPASNISLNIEGNSGRTTIVQGDAHETHQGNEFVNVGTINGDVLPTGNKTSIETNMGKAQIQVSGGLHTGKGDVVDSAGGQPLEEYRNKSKSPASGKVSIKTNFDEAKISTAQFHSGEGDIIMVRTTESVAPKGFYFQDDPDLAFFKNSKTEKVKPDANLDNIFDEWRYPIKAFGKNQALILNNWDFKDPAFNRKGADMDTTHLMGLLRDLGFLVTKKENLTKAQIIDEVKKFTRSGGMGQASISLVFIGSHGAQLNNEDRFMDINGEMIPVDEIINLFDGRNAPMLLGIPKIFLFQFCRVLQDEADSVEDLASDDATKFEWFEKKLPTVAVESVVQKPHLLADMFIGCATAPGSSAFRNTGNGSWFVTTMKKVFQQNAYKQDMSTLFLKINDTVMNKKGSKEETVQMCIYTSSLRRKIYFYPQ